MQTGDVPWRLLCEGWSGPSPDSNGGLCASTPVRRTSEAVYFTFFFPKSWK